MRPPDKLHEPMVGSLPKYMWRNRVSTVLRGAWPSELPRGGNVPRVVAVAGGSDEPPPPDDPFVDLGPDEAGAPGSNTKVIVPEKRAQSLAKIPHLVGNHRADSLNPGRAMMEAQQAAAGGTIPAALLQEFTAVVQEMAALRRSAPPNAGQGDAIATRTMFRHFTALRSQLHTLNNSVTSITQPRIREIQQLVDRAAAGGREYLRGNVATFEWIDRLIGALTRDGGNTSAAARQLEEIRERLDELIAAHRPPAYAPPDAPPGYDGPAPSAPALSEFDNDDRMPSFMRPSSAAGSRRSSASSGSSGGDGPLPPGFRRVVKGTTAASSAALAVAAASSGAPPEVDMQTGTEYANRLAQAAGLPPLGDDAPPDIGPGMPPPPGEDGGGGWGDSAARVMQRAMQLAGHLRQTAVENPAAVQAAASLVGLLMQNQEWIANHAPNALRGIMGAGGAAAAIMGGGGPPEGVAGGAPGPLVVGDLVRQAIVPFGGAAATMAAAAAGLAPGNLAMPPPVPPPAPMMDAGEHMAVAMRMPAEVQLDNDEIDFVQRHFPYGMEAAYGSAMPDPTTQNFVARSGTTYEELIKYFKQKYKKRPERTDVHYDPEIADLAEYSSARGRSPLPHNHPQYWEDINQRLYQRAVRPGASASDRQTSDEMSETILHSAAAQRRALGNWHESYTGVPRGVSREDWMARHRFINIYDFDPSKPIEQQSDRFYRLMKADALLDRRGKGGPGRATLQRYAGNTGVWRFDRHMVTYNRNFNRNRGVVHPRHREDDNFGEGSSRQGGGLGGTRRR